MTINGQAARGDGLKASFRTASVAASLTFATDSNEANATATLNIVGGGALFQIGEQATSAGQIGLGIEAVNTSRLGGITANCPNWVPVVARASKMFARASMVPARRSLTKTS